MADEGDEPLSVDMTQIFIISVKIHYLSSPIAPSKGDILQLILMSNGGYTNYQNLTGIS